MKILRSKTVMLASLAMFSMSGQIANADTQTNSGAEDDIGDVTVMTADLRPNALSSSCDASIYSATGIIALNDSEPGPPGDASGLFGPVETSWEAAGGPLNFLVAFSPRDKPPGKEGCMNPSLTDDQMKKLMALRDQNRIDTASKHAELIALHHKMTTLLSEASIDRKAVNDLFSKMSALKSDLGQQHLKLMLDSAEVFTPEQRAKMQQMNLRRQSGPPMPPHVMLFGGPMGMDDFGPPPFGGPMMGFPSPGMGPHHGPPPPPGFGFGRPPGGGPHGGHHAGPGGPGGPDGPPKFRGSPHDAPPPPPPGENGFDKKGPSGPPPQGGGEPDK